MQLRYYGFENKFKKIGLDENKDYYNADHMNIYGKKKFTYYYLKFLAYPVL